MVSAIFTEVSNAITAFTSALSNAVGGVTSMFYDTTDGLTVLGSLLLIAVGVGIVYWAFRLIKGLIRRA